MASKRLIIFSVFLCLICSEAAPKVDETVVMDASNFTELVAKNRFMMILFCMQVSHECLDLEPEYTAAAAELKAEAVPVVLAKVDAIEDDQLMMKFNVLSVPTIIFANGVHFKPYTGERNKDAIVTWLKKMTGSTVQTITTAEDAKRLLAEEDKIVLGYLGSLEGSDHEELFAAAHIEDDVSFYQTTSADVARLFHIDPSVKRPALVIIKKELERVTHFGGQFTGTSIAKFVLENKHPLVFNVTHGTSLYFLHSFNKPVLGLMTIPRDTKKTYAIFQKVAKAFKGKLVCGHLEVQHREFAPMVVAQNYLSDPLVHMHEDFTLKNIKRFAKKFLSNTYPLLFLKNDDIKDVTVGNFEEVVLDESKDVLLQMYHPRSRLCQDLDPIYNNLAKNLRGINSLVIARMDIRFDERAEERKDLLPIILLYRAGKETFYPIHFEGDPTLGNLYKFVKKHAWVPFELREWDVKDEL